MAKAPSLSFTISPAPSPLQDGWTDREMNTQLETSVDEPKPVSLQLPLSGLYSVLWEAAGSPGENPRLGVGRPTVNLALMLLC